MLSGDNGILQKTTTAKQNSEKAQIEERINLAYHSALTEGQGSYTKDSLMNELENEFKTDYDVDDSDKENWKMKAHGQEVIIPAGIKIEIFAKDRLIIDENAETSAKKTPFVSYFLPDGSKIMCRVLYNDDNGIDIISSSTMTDKSLGRLWFPWTKPATFTYNGIGKMDDDVKKVASSYNNAFSILNGIAEDYRNKSDGIAESARCVGSPRGTTKDTQDNKNYYTSNYSYMNTYKWNNAFKTADTNYIEDYQQMKKLGILSAGNGYWLASRYVGASSSRCDFHLWAWKSGSTVAHRNLFSVLKDGTSVTGGINWDFSMRPVFHLSDDVKILKGDGSSGSPFLLYK